MMVDKPAPTSSPTPSTAPPPGFSTAADGWKVVGSPSRRGSLQANPSSPTESQTSPQDQQQQQQQITAKQPIQSQTQQPSKQQQSLSSGATADSSRPRNRCSSSPTNHILNGVDISPLMFPSSVSSPGVMNDTTEKWASLGLQWNNRRPSIWGDSHATDALSDRPGSPPKSVDSPQRTQRSLSVAVGHSAELIAALAARNRPIIEEPLRPDVDDISAEEYDQIHLAKMRARSKSISTYDPAVPPHGDVHSDVNDLAAIWNRTQGVHSGGPYIHRRSSTTPYATPWDQAPASPTGYGIPPDRLERLRGQRRFSLSPNIHSSEFDSFTPVTSVERQPLPSHMSPRRHSVAGPLAYTPPGRYLADAFNAVRLDDREPRSNLPYGYSNLLEDVEDIQIEDQRNRNAYSEIGRGVPLNALPSNTKLYIVEFKAGRSDVYYVAETNSGVSVKKGDLVIVEADRGKDLGKVINDAITPHQIHMLQAQQGDSSELHRVAREIRPKRIYRLAQPQEVTMLVNKSQDEAKAMAVCQTKVRQKKLPMEVVDGEYQWDRRKLTFYFIADRRIDFRELVRDLFKIYKTRIWMCAVNPVPHPLKTLIENNAYNKHQP